MCLRASGGYMDAADGCAEVGDAGAGDGRGGGLDVRERVVSKCAR